MIELMISSLLIIVVMYGAGNVYLSFFAAQRRGTAKLRLQEDATQASEQLVRRFRTSDSVAVSGSGTSMKVRTYDKGNAVTTDSFYVTTTSGRNYLLHNSGAGAEWVVASSLDSLAVASAGHVARLTLRLADTTGNKVTTLAAAALRN